MLYIVRREQRKGFFFLLFFEKTLDHLVAQIGVQVRIDFLQTRMKVSVIHKGHCLLVAKKPTTLLPLSSSPSFFSALLLVSLVLVIIAKKDERSVILK